MPAPESSLASIVGDRFRVGLLENRLFFSLWNFFHKRGSQVALSTRRFCTQTNGCVQPLTLAIPFGIVMGVGTGFNKRKGEPCKT